MTREGGSFWGRAVRRFTADRGIRLVLDRRQGERRQRSQAPHEERRHTERRRPENDDLGEIDGFIGEGIQSHGALEFRGAFRIDGRLEGEHVRGETLIIGEQGVVHAAIEAGVVQVSGEVLGDIIAKRSVELFESSTMTGTIRSPRLVIWKGAVFNGTCEMPAAQSPDRVASQQQIQDDS